jgi:hypothetical protein
MNEEVFNTTLRQFLKKVGITAQREIEKAVRDGVESGHLKGTESLRAKATISVSGVDLTFDVDGTIQLA